MNREKLSLEALNRISPKEFEESDKLPLVIILDNVRSMNNVGSVFRTSDAFRIEKIYLCGITPTPPHREIQKTALGATETVAWEQRNSTLELVKELQEKDYMVYSIEQTKNSEMLDNFLPNKDKKYAFILGNEVEGVAQEVVDQSNGVIEIPQFGTKHSLNVSITCGIIIWDFYSKTKL